MPQGLKNLNKDQIKTQEFQAQTDQPQEMDLQEMVPRSNVWQCYQCTFENELFREQCQICYALKPS